MSVFDPRQNHHLAGAEVQSQAFVRVLGCSVALFWVVFTVMAICT
jgi:hypothetical protein